MPGKTDGLNEIALSRTGSEIYSAIAQNFPVSSASDEFYYFPQVRVPTPDWGVWDRFSSDFIPSFVRQLSAWETELDQLIITIPSPSRAGYSESRVLKKVTQTLREQLDLIRVWETQPSFYLTLCGIGLAEALGAGQPQARDRARTLADFLDQAGENLTRVPALFRDIGIEMVPDTRQFFVSRLADLPELKSAIEALDRFDERLQTLVVQDHFTLPEHKLVPVVKTHINCGMDIREVNDALDLEIDEMTHQLAGEARQLNQPNWRSAYDAIPLPDPRPGGLIELYKGEVRDLARHCRSAGLVSQSLYQANPVRVMPVPGYLSAIRAASAYSIPPGNPPRGGFFYVFNARDPEEALKDYHREYRILTAHETWPGHHLLDISRWSLDAPVLRAVEQPIFYEGWACFAEELLWQTGWLAGPGDRLMLLKRRLWRAIRGKADIGVQTGALTLAQGAGLLTRTGMNPKQALSSVRKYSLNPGYQLCYTLGLKAFLTLFEQYGKKRISRFSQTVLRCGEIGFNELERILTSTPGRGTGPSFKKEQTR